MFSNYLKTAWRNLVKNRFYSFVNIAGLTLGLTIGLIILLWVQDEYSFDAFHRQGPNIIKVENMVGTNASRQLWSSTASPIGVMAKKQIPGVKDVVRLCGNYLYSFYRYQDKKFYNERGFFADASLFTVFDFPLIKGDKSNPFPDMHSIVITTEAAKKYFGDAEPIGKIIEGDDSVNFRVSGLIADFPKNSSFRASLFFPMQLLAQRRYAGNEEGLNLENDFRQYDFDTFLLLEPGFSFAGFADKLRNLHLGVKPDDTDVGYVWLPLSKLHLFHSDGTEGGAGTVRMFLFIAILILVIACINYVNLSTARSMLRSKEVSLRKIVGAAKWQLFIQFIIETALLFMFAVIVALALVYLLIPLFNEVSGKQMVVNYRNYNIWLVVGLTIAGTLVVSSIYPALLLSSFEPLSALKGRISRGVSSVLLRKALVAIQFSFSIALIAGTIVIGKQLRYIQTRQLGYDRENVMSMRTIHMSPHLDAVMDELSKTPGVRGVCWSSADIVNMGGQTGDNAWDGKQTGETVMVSPINVDKDFIPFFKMTLLEGSNFVGSSADSAHFILNETAVKAMRLTNPLGKRLRLWKTEGTITGIVKDFNFQSVRQKIKPAVLYSQHRQYGNIYMKTTGGALPGVVAAARAQWEKYNGEFPFNYNFLDETFRELYEGEQRTGLLFNIFAAIAVVISCLGLLGLAAYTAQVRTKEIGIRKVLGASIAGIMQLLAADFLKLVLIAFVVATPFAWWLMNQWLRDFAYKINIGWPVFALAGILSVAIALLTISFQSVRAALANPVKSLRTE